MEKIDEALKKLSPSNSAKDVIDALETLHKHFRALEQKSDVDEVILESDILEDLYNLISGHPSNEVKIEAHSLMSVLSMKSCWSDEFGSDSYLGLVSNILLNSSSNIPLACKAISATQHVFEASENSSQSLSSFSGLVFSLTEVLKSPELDNQERENILKSLLFILDKYKIEEDKPKKGPKGKKEKASTSKPTSSSSSSFSSSSSTARRIAPPLPITMLDMVGLVSKLEKEGSVFIRSHAKFILILAKDKFKIKVPSQKKGRKEESESERESESEAANEASGSEDEAIEGVKYVPNTSPGYTLSKLDITFNSTAYPTLFLNEKMSEGVFKLKVTHLQYMMLGVAEPSQIQSVQNMYFQTHSALYFSQLTTADLYPTYNGQCSAPQLTAVPNSTIISAEVNMDDRTMFFFIGKQPFPHYLTGIPKTCQFGISNAGGTGTIQFVSFVRKAQPSLTKKEKGKLSAHVW